MRGPILIIFVISLFAICSCNNEEEVLGKTSIAAKEGFKLITPFTLSTSTANFANGDIVTGSAKFNQEVTYNIKIEGLTSGAVRNFSGTGASIDPVFFQWKGRHEELHFFEEGENAEVVLSFIGTNETHKQVLKIDSIYNYLSHPDLYASTKLTNENGKYSWNELNSGVWGLDLDIEGSSIVDETKLGFKIPEGKHAFLLATRGTKKGYQAGLGSQIFQAATQLNTPDASRTWINFYVYGENQSGVTLEFAVMEDDCSIRCDFCVQTQNCLDQDFRFIQIPITHTGWKLFSIRYQDLKTSHFNGRKGNEIPEPKEFINYSFGLVSSDKSPKRMIVDMPFITYGKPFIPKEF